jgi:hypothetical protein
VVAGEEATCTITNEREVPETGLLTITKLCIPADDEGEFDILLDGVNQGQVGCGESVFDIDLVPGTYTVSESGADGTDLTDYTTSFGGACDSAGDVTIDAGEDLTCTITNDREEVPETGSLTITKECIPDDDSGEFAILLDGVSQGQVGCGESVFDLDLASGTYTVSEAGANGTDLGDYTTTFSGACDSSGEVTIDVGDDLTCTITNDLISVVETGSLTITKVCIPADDTGEFDILLNGVTQDTIGCGESVFDLDLAPGTFTVSEAAGPGTDLGDYTSSFGGACDSSGDVTIAAGDDLTCTITNDFIEITIVIPEAPVVEATALPPAAPVEVVEAVPTAVPTTEAAAVLGVTALPSTGSGGSDAAPLVPLLLTALLAGLGGLALLSSRVIRP